MKILKFGAVWCPGCLVMRPRWLEIEKEMPDLKTEYFDYDEDTNMVQKWKIGSILPVFIFIDDNNNELERLIGEQSKRKLLEIIAKYQ